MSVNKDIEYESFPNSTFVFGHRGEDYYWLEIAHKEISDDLLYKGFLIEDTNMRNSFLIHTCQFMLEELKERTA